jgi:hypothetical protein
LATFAPWYLLATFAPWYLLATFAPWYRLVLIRGVVLDVFFY